MKTAAMLALSCLFLSAVSCGDNRKDWAIPLPHHLLFGDGGPRKHRRQQQKIDEALSRWAISFTYAQLTGWIRSEEDPVYDRQRKRSA
ncbi:MAG: hypothetical protein ACLRSW_10365 [Christensenellaceae bacterium]